MWTDCVLPSPVRTGLGNQPDSLLQHVLGEVGHVSPGESQRPRRVRVTEAKEPCAEQGFLFLKAPRGGGQEPFCFPASDAFPSQD